MAERRVCYIHNIAPNGSVFALREDTDETVYISPSLARPLHLELMDEVEVIVMKNTSQHAGSTPWSARAIRLLDETEED